MFRRFVTDNLERIDHIIPPRTPRFHFPHAPTTHSLTSPLTPDIRRANRLANRFQRRSRSPPRYSSALCEITCSCHHGCAVRPDRREQEKHGPPGGLAQASEADPRADGDGVGPIPGGGIGVLSFWNPVDLLAFLQFPIDHYIVV